MKKLAIAFLILLVLVGGGVVYVIANVGRFLESYKPTMERNASDALGAPVHLGDFSVSLFPTTQLLVTDLRVDSVQEGEEGLSLENLVFEMDLAALLGREVRIKTLRLERPKLVLLLEEDGVFVSGLPRGTVASAEATPAVPSGEIPSEDPAVEGLTATLESFELRDASVVVRDTISGNDYTLDAFNLSAAFALTEDDVSMNGLRGSGTLMKEIPFTFTGDGVGYSIPAAVATIGSMAVETMGSNLRASGTLNPNDASDVLNIASDGIYLEKFTPFYNIFLPAGNEYGLTGTARPDLNVALGAEGRYTVTGTLALDNGSAGVEGLVFEGLTGVVHVDANNEVQQLRAEDMSAALQGAPLEIDFAARLDGETGAVEPLHIDAFGGGSDLITRLDLTDETLPFETSLRMTGLDLEETLAALSPDNGVEITGTIESVNGDIGSTLDENMMPGVAGTASFALADGLVKDVNIGREVLGNIKDIPFISGALLSVVPPGLQTFMEKDHTVLQSVSADFDVANETLTTENLQVVSDFFTMNGAGTIGFDSALDLDTTVHFNPDFSQAMVDRTDGLRVMLDDQGRLTLPVEIEGIAPDLSIRPRVGDILKGAAKETLKEEAGKLLEGVLGGEDEEDSGGSVVNRLRNRFNN